MFAPFAAQARAKVNLALHVLGRREDGYHELDSVVAFADVGDELRFTPADRFVIEADGPYADQLPDAPGNIIFRAWQAVAELAEKQNRILPPVAVRLTKNLPVASGIGGGSANAAAALRAFLKIAGLPDRDPAIAALAMKLGADVPVCLAGTACRMQGAGERIAAFEGFRPHHALLVNPSIPVSTPEVFQRLGLARGQSYRDGVKLHDPAHWRNDLTEPAIAVAPVIADVLRILESLPGVTRAAMSGSGATCFALFEEAPAREIANLLQPGWWRMFTIVR
ncbi:4-(cytidine 5'-diphospho)-2-C-methyl-D-erythritol kinase [Aestuariivirga sp.]|uniref:4-(cytidine 5'-diphospho)-2-C-methyl-D-erythritol kinase n=1 Tax=Aestuariivirga sp. TaxID=2650926 RepID=UPI0039E49197